MNYTQLSAAIVAYTENTSTDFAAQIPVFVQQAEQRIYNSIQFPSLRKNVMGTTTNANKYLACPTDFLAVYSIAVINADGTYEYLLNKDVNFIRQAYPDPNAKAFPKYYALFGPAVNGSTITNELTFILGPTPDANYNVELHYFYYPESIVTANTSWLGDNFDSVLLYGSLVEAYTYMKGEQDMMMYYQKKFDDALMQLNRLGTGLERGDAYRDGQAKIKVNP